MTFFEIKHFLSRYPNIFSISKKGYNNIMRYITYPHRRKLFNLKIKEIINAHQQGYRIIWYCCPAIHPNLGDLAQTSCTINWLQENYPNRLIIELPSRDFYFNTNKFLDNLQNAIYPDDIIVFQSGYTMTGLHEHEAMRKIIINYFPAIRIVLLPQTIFYKEKKYAEWAIGVYKDRKNVLLLTRDRVSYEIAKSLFGSTQIVLYPDIVTTLIGKMTFTNIRNGILFCVRDDWERLYTKKDMNDLIQKLSTFSYTERTDTTIKIQNTLDRKSIEKLVIATIEKYSRYRVVITDRFHGTIFALAANTPVIVLKTTDHKVTIGAEWFQPYMTGYIYVADNLSDAEKLTKQIFEKTYDYKIAYSFKEKYYDHLKLLIDGENNHDNL